MRAFVITDLSNGDSCKGSLTDYLARVHNADWVVRYNGGAQAAHNVITPDGRHHTFSQFGSGTFVDGVRTHLSRFTLVNPAKLFTEAEQLAQVGVRDALMRLSIDAAAPITTPFHVAANRLREMARGDARHGSCGLGIGETMMDLFDGHVIRAGDVTGRPQLLRARLRAMQERKREQMRPIIEALGRPAGQLEEAWPLYDPSLVGALAEIYGTLGELVEITDAWRPHGTMVFEGAQGVLLDEWRGFHPYTTWSTTTTANADALLSNFDGEVERIGVARAYATRHGAGPLVTEDPQLTREMPDVHNRFNDWQHGWRVGYTDLVALRYALSVAGPIDSLAITCVDRVERRRDWKVAMSYQLDDEPYDLQAPRHRPQDLDAQRTVTEALLRCRPNYVDVDPGAVVDLLERELGLPVAITSHGPVATDKRDRAAVETSTR